MPRPASTPPGVRLLLLTERAAMERVLEYIVQGSSAQMGDPAFISELKTWIRFNGAEAVRSADGLYGAASGHPEIPTWIGDLALRWVFTPKGENEKCALQVRSSAGVAVFVGEAADKAHWVQVGRACERFALQATALGIRNAFLMLPRARRRPRRPCPRFSLPMTAEFRRIAVPANTSRHSSLRRRAGEVHALAGRCCRGSDGGLPGAVCTAAGVASAHCLRTRCSGGEGKPRVWWRAGGHATASTAASARRWILPRGV